MAAVLLAEPATVAEPLLERLRLLGVRVPRPAEVRDYVKQFPDVVPVARQACDAAVDEFAGKASLSLELYLDPEIDDPHLTLYVGAVSADAWVWQAIERIEEKYSEALTATAGWLVVMPDFRGGARA